MKLHFLAPNDKTKWAAKWEFCLKTWQNNYSSIKIWSDSDIDSFLKSNDPKFFKILNQLHKIFKLDYVRGLILEKIGGAYIDIDIELKSPFIHQLDESKIYIIQASAEDEILQNSLMISPPSDFWKDFLTFCRDSIYNNLDEVKAYPNLIENVPGTIVRKTVGPIALSEFTTATNNHFEILPAKLFNDSEGICFTKHHQTGIWGFLD